MPSERIDDAWVLQRVEIHRWHEDQRPCIRVADGVSQVAVYFNLDFFPTAGAFCLDGKRQQFVSELPLHEGRRNRVDRSGSVNALTAAERHALGRGCGRDRVGPQNCSRFVPVQEC
jgi:hypothetical protein